MTASINNQSLTGVSLNAFSMRDGKLQVQTLELNRRTSKKSGAVATDKGNFHSFYEQQATNPKPVIDSENDLITNVVPSRSSSTVVLVLDGGDDYGTAGHQLADDLEGILVGEQPNVDYLEPANDLPKYDFTGTYEFTEEETRFLVEDIVAL